MENLDLRVPTALLLDPVLAPTSKLIWLLLTTQAGQSPAQLASRSGLTPRTVRKCLLQLNGADLVTTPEVGLYTAVRVIRAPVAHIRQISHIPCTLLSDRRTGVAARLLYGVLQLTPGFEYPSGQFTYASLSRITGTSAKTVKFLVRNLVRTGWIQATQANQLAPLRFTLRNPVAEHAAEEVALAKHRLSQARYHGEAIMRELLSLLVDSDQFIDDADPGFLVNPATLGKLELDRFYPPSVAFEFQGPQHDHPTEKYSDEKVAIQKARDYIKAGMCLELGITLITVRPEELSLKTMQDKIGALLPLRDLSGHGRLVGFLERVARRYRPKAQKWKQRKSG